MPPEDSAAKNRFHATVTMRSFILLWIDVRLHRRGRRLIARHDPLGAEAGSCRLR
jgi:hypothetical protein